MGACDARGVTGSASSPGTKGEEAAAAKWIERIYSSYTRMEGKTFWDHEGKGRDDCTWLCSWRCGKVTQLPSAAELNLPCLLASDIEI